MSRPLVIRWTAAVLAGMAANQTHAAVERIEILEREPYASGKDFPGVGSYETIRGRAWFALDPESSANNRIVDLKLARRDARGRVTFASDFVLQRPVASIDSTLIYDMPNRGLPTSYLLSRAPNPKGGEVDIDDGFLNRHGFTVLASAWAWDIAHGPKGERRLIFEPPIAEVGKPRGQIANEFIVSAPSRSASFVGIEGRAYPPAVPNDPAAVLTARARPDDQRIPIARAKWWFVSNGKDPPTHIATDEEFAPGLIYEVSYIARDPFVVGTGLAGIRDLLSWFRSNPFAGKPPAKRVVMLGVSQTGRAIRHMIHDGFNVDEQGKLAFDGAIAMVAGAGRGSFNHRFAFPTRASSFIVDRDYPTDLPPFIAAPAHGSRTGKFLNRAADSAGKLPKLFFVNASSEFWGRAASLIGTSEDGMRDVEPPPYVRNYLLSGLQHFRGSSARLGGTANCTNTLDRTPTIRALLVAMERWVKEGAVPPPSAYPKVADGTLVTVGRYRELFPRDVLTPPTTAYTPVALDLGPQFASSGRVERLPPKRGRAFTALVPAPDNDGIDRAGLKLPEVAVPLGTYTGWNPNSTATGFSWTLERFQGSFKPFARTDSERREAGDPRPSLEERYGSRVRFANLTRAAAQKAVHDRTLLAEDVERVVEIQSRFYDRIMAREPGVGGCEYIFP